MNSISLVTAPVIPTAPKLTSRVNGDSAEWKRIASIIAVIAITVLAFCIALGVTLTASVFAVIGSAGAASITIGGTAVVLGISLVVRHVLAKRNEASASEPQKPASKPLVEPPKPPSKTPVDTTIKPVTPKAKTNALPDVGPTPQKPPKTPPPSNEPKKFIFNTPTKTLATPATHSTPSKPTNATPTVPPSPSSKKSGKASLVQGLRDQKSHYHTFKNLFDSVASDTSVTDADKAKAFHQKGMLALSHTQYKEAFAAFEEAAKLEHDPSMLEIGKLHYSGDGVDQDISRAIEWFEKAHELGNADAAKKLSNIYIKGLGVPQDKDKGEQYLKEIV